MLKNNNKYCSVFLICVLVVCLRQSAYTEPLVGAIDDGFVFLFGEYIQPPYIITIDNLKISVNGRQIPKPECSPSEGLLFGDRPLDSLTKQEQDRFSIRLKVAKRKYEVDLKRKNGLIFDNSGYNIVDLYTLVYKTPPYIQVFRKNSKSLNSRLESMYEVLLQVDRFGETKGVPVENGFIFLNSEYLDVPYTVTRRGLGIFINNRLVESPGRWLDPSKTEEIALRDTNEILLEISPDSSIYDYAIAEYISVKLTPFKNYSKEDQMNVMIDEYKKLPCVSNAYIAPDDSSRIILEWRDGSIERINPSPPIGRMLDTNFESILKESEFHRSNYEDRLKKGDYYILSSAGGRITGNEKSAHEFLPPIMRILRSGKTKSEVLSELSKNKNIYDLGKNIIEVIDPNKFMASPQLEKRLNRN
jgi:hypothetical protein